MDGPASNVPVSRAAIELDEEEQELWRQLRRKRDFEARIDEKRSLLGELRTQGRGTRAAAAGAAASVEHLDSQVQFARQQVKELEYDLAVLKESNRILQQTFQSSTVRKPTDGRRPKEDILSEEKARHESAQAQHEQIEHLRMHIESLRAEKSSFQQRQQALFQKQRAAEQDRNRLLGALQDDRSTVNQMRSERIRLCEERTSLEREVALLAREALVDRAAVPSGEPADP
ncbi:unnamed protein product, partial [Polarella glacialis]